MARSVSQLTVAVMTAAVVVVAVVVVGMQPISCSAINNIPAEPRVCEAHPPGQTLRHGGRPPQSCFFQTIVEGGECVPRNNSVSGPGLIIEFAPDPTHIPVVDRIPAENITTATRDALASTARVVNLQLTGILHSKDLEWLLGTTWPTVDSIELSGLVNSSLDLSTMDALPNLRRIDAAGNQIIALTKIKNKQLPFAANLVYFNLADNLLSTIPDALFNGLENLKSLILNDNLLTDLSPALLASLPSLQFLNVRNNRIPNLAAATFQPTPDLRALDLRANRISSLHTDLFKPLRNLTHLWLANNRQLTTDTLARTARKADDSYGTRDCALNKYIDGKPEDPQCNHSPTCDGFLPRASASDSDVTAFLAAGAFDTLTNLCHLDMGELNLITIPANLFANLGNLTFMSLSGNMFPTLPQTLLHGLTRLATLSLDRNRIECLPALLFRDQVELRVLGLSRNRLACLPQNLFPPTNKLERVGLASNRLHTLPRDAVQALSQLVFLQLDANSFSSFNHNLPALRALQLSHNCFLGQLPDLDALPSLEALRLANHRIPRIRMSDFAALRSLKRLDISRPEARTDVTTLEFAGASPAAFAQLESLDFRNLRPDAAIRPFFEARALVLRELYMGHSSMGSALLPIQAICDNLGVRVREFALLATSYREITLCEARRFDTVFVARNAHLASITSHGPLNHLDVSDCARLHTLNVTYAKTLDISGTALPVLPELCSTLGSSMLFARYMSHNHFRQAEVVADLATRCLGRLTILDLSQNTELRSFGPLSDRLGGAVVLSADRYRTADLAAAVPSRPTPPVFNLDQNPVGCRIALRTSRVRPVDEDNSVLTAELAYSFVCECSAQFHHRNGRCVPVGLAPEAVAGIAVASVVVGLLLGAAHLVWQWYRRHRAERRQWHERAMLKDRLLQEKDQEVIELKKAWEIDYDDLDFVDRVDGSSPGTYGEVWRARWDSLVVAVKVLKQGLMVMDENTVAEFQKEVEFLQKTRHAHVVRFFGAGQAPSGVPFLVLELVALGSLRSILSGNLLSLIEDANAAVLQGKGGHVLAASTSDASDDGVSGVSASALRLHASSWREESLHSTAMEEGPVPMDVFDQSNASSVLSFDGTGSSSGGGGGGGGGGLFAGKDGSTLARRKQGRLIASVWELKVRLASDIACGMRYIHSLDLAHRYVCVSCVCWCWWCWWCVGGVLVLVVCWWWWCVSVGVLVVCWCVLVYVCVCLVCVGVGGVGVCWCMCEYDRRVQCETCFGPGTYPLHMRLPALAP